MRGNCVAGIDLALRLSGFCILDKGRYYPGLIDASKFRGTARLAYIRDELVRLVLSAEPKMLALEGYSFGSTNRAFDLGEVGGIVLLLAYDAGIPLVIPTPKQLKRFVSGSGSASKWRMIESVAMFYGVTTLDNNMADATGLARLAEVYLVNKSNRRCEMEVVGQLRNPKSNKKIRFKKERTNV